MNKTIQKLAVSVIEVKSANAEKAVRQKLVEMGWTPPEASQLCRENQWRTLEGLPVADEYSRAVEQLQADKS